MNTRLQVEHPVTEAITGLDLVEWQLRVASGETLPLAQGEIAMSGHAIEARLNAENPAQGFPAFDGSHRRVRDSPALEGLRVDSGVEAGSVISPFYNSMIGKLIASGARPAAGDCAAGPGPGAIRGRRSQDQRGVPACAVTLPDFAAGRMDTGLIARELSALAPKRGSTRARSRSALRTCCGADTTSWRPARQETARERYSPWSVQDAFGLSGPRRQRLMVLVDGKETKVEASWGAAGPGGVRLGAASEAAAEPRSLRVVGEADPLYVICDMVQAALRWPIFEGGAIAAEGDGGSIRAPIIGRLAKVFVKEGDTVAKGDRIAVVEAMKMEHVLHAARAGRIAKLAAKEGDQLGEGALIASLADA